jgi:four helix bundle protein
LLYAWPGAIYEGNGEMQAIIDERADDQQRDALRTVLYGGETEEAKTHWWVFHAMSATVHEPIYKAIDCEIDIEKRTARVTIPDVLESRGRPIISPATGDAHRVRIEHPEGIEFAIAEIGSASSTASGAIPLNLAEGSAEAGTRQERRYYRIARASAAEVDACLCILHRAGLITAELAAEGEDTMNKVSAMIYGLIQHSAERERRHEYHDQEWHTDHSPAPSLEPILPSAPSRRAGPCKLACSPPCPTRFWKK